MASNVNPRTFFDFTIAGEPQQRVVFELFKDKTPNTAENFRCLCTGERGLSTLSKKPLHYMGSRVHRVIKNFMIQGGDITKGDGRGGESIYGKTFDDENFDTDCEKPGLLVMANRGPNTNSSQFFITVAPAEHLNGKHVVFGRVVFGYNTVEKISQLETSGRDVPIQEVIIVKSGELEMRKRSAPVKEQSPKRQRKNSTASDSASSASYSSSESGGDERRRQKRASSVSSSSSKSDSEASSDEDNRRKSRRREKEKKRAKKEEKKRRKEEKKERKQRDKKLRNGDGSDKDEASREQNDEESTVEEKEANERRIRYMEERAKRLREYEERKASNNDKVIIRGRGRTDGQTKGLRGWR